MSTPVSEDDILRVCRILNTSGIPYVAIGGMALALWGDPRLTFDLDFLIYLPNDAEVQKLLDHCLKQGLQFDKNRSLETFKTHRAFVGKSGEIDLDFLVAGTAWEAELYQRRRVVPYSGLDIPVPSAEDLILLKIVTGRPKDILDAENIVKRQGDQLDRRYLEMWVGRFQAKRPDQPLLERFKKLIDS